MLDARLEVVDLFGKRVLELIKVHRGPGAVQEVMRAAQTSICASVLPGAGTS